jgi:phosphatidylserine/phosphatidylglycerophosphate/cardiolipin synthase-like enzyme
MMKQLILIAIVLLGFKLNAQVPIASVQGQQELSPMNNQTVTIRGIVTASKSGGQGYFVQDADSAWSGIYVYDLNRSPLPELGDEVRLTGKVTEYYNLTEIKDVTSFEVLSKGNKVPEPILLKTGEIDEAYEGVLIKVENATCTKVSLGYGEWEVNDGSGPAVVNDLYYAFTPTSGVSYDITGPLDFSFEFYKIEPRFAADVVINAALFYTVKPHQTSLSKSSITLEWETNAPAIAEVLYGKTEALELGSIKLENPAKSHQITISNLDAGELYHIKSFSALNGDTTPVVLSAYTTISNSSGQIRVCFTMPEYKMVTAANGNQNMVNDYTPSITDTIVHYMNKARETLDIAIYDVINHSPESDKTNQRIFDAVKAQAQAGVKVRVITDDESNDPFFTELQEYASVVKGNSDGIMHHKFIIVDAESEKDSWLVTGSVNWTYNNLVMDANNLVMIQDRSLAKAYRAEFNEMWGSNHSEPNESKSRFGAQKSDNTPHYFNIGGKQVALYFSPSDQTESKIVEALNTADHQIAFSMMAFTSDALGQALLAAHQRGVEVMGVIDYVEYSGSEFEPLVNAGIDVIDFTNPTGLSWPDDITIHHKFAVVDYDYPESGPLVITGTHNWTASAESRNDENTLIIHDHQLAKKYFDETVLIYSASGGGNAVQSFTDDISVYPNPVSSLLNIQSESIINSYLIFDANGKLISGENLLSVKSHTIDVTGFQKGIYLLRLTTAKKGVTISRFVVQ